MSDQSPPPSDGDPAGRDDGRHAGFDAAFDGPEWARNRPRPRRDTGRPGRAGRSHRRRRRRRNRRIRRTVGFGLGGLLLLTVGWIVVTALLARSQLSDARSELTSLRAQLADGQIDQARGTARTLAVHARRAHVLTTGPAWATAAAVPWVGDPLTTVRGLTTETSALATHAVPGLITVADQINPRTVVTGGDTVDLAALTAAATPVHQASAALGAARSKVADLPSSTWLPFVDSARTSVSGQLTGLGKTLTTADQALQVLPTMLGADGTPRHYFIAFQNNAELRGTGGLPGGFAIATAVNGRITLDRFESDTLLDSAVSGLDFGTAYDQHYAGDMPYTQYVDSNVSPNFPYAARIWCAMWENVSGQKLDGALTVDPSALSYLLAASGPATAPDGVSVTSANVVSLLQKDVYAKFPAESDNADRKPYILAVAEAAEKKILAGGGDSRTMVKALARGVSERRIVAWSNDPAAEAVLAQAPIGGVVATTTQPYSMMSINNGAGGKLDYYLRRSIRWERTGCGDARTVKVTITLTNTAPASGLPPYVSDRIDKPTYSTVPGQNRSVVDYIATDGAQLLGVTLDGQTTGASVFDEEGHPTYRVIPEIVPGQTVTIVLTLQEPAGSQPVTVIKQPGVTPLVASVDDASCS